ncbi:hypothetical protein BSKO_07712 [Bryopsis sp. KO-2023]|nr:hypothetical protein BSKO_07712 [Bryopsis sp. KO-2023]
MSGNSWIVKKPRPGAPSGSGSSAFQVTIVEEPVTWEKNGTDTDSLISSEADIGESCSNSVPGSCGDESQESSGHRNNSPGQFDTPRPSALMKPSIPPLACPPSNRWNHEHESANNATQLELSAAGDSRSYHNRGASGHTSEEGAEQFSLGEKSTIESMPYLTPRLGWKEDVDRPPTPDRNGFEVPIARKPFVGERDLGPNSTRSKSPTPNPLALNIPPKEHQETIHGEVNSPKQSADSDEVAQLSARLGSPLPEDFYQSTTTASSNEPRRYSNLIFERAQDFLMGWMVQHPPGISDSVKMASPFSMSSNEGGSSSGQLESEVTVSDLVHQREGIPRQDSPVVLPRLTPLLPQVQKNTLPEITERGKEIEGGSESESDQEPEDIGRVPSIPRSAGARERIKHSERWEDDDDSFLELSINTKSDSGTTETFSSFKLPLDESGNDQVLASRTSANKDIPPPLPSRRSSKSVTSGRPPRPQQSQDGKNKRADANRLANMLQHEDSEDLFRDTARVREYVRALQSIARTGSITSVRRALGVEEPESEISEICEMVDALEAQSTNPTGSEGNAARKLTMFWDAEEASPDGPVFWKEETADEVKRMATSMIEEAEDYYSMDLEETNGSERERCDKVGKNQKFDDEVRLLTSNQFAAVAEQLREVIKVKSSRLDADESGEFSNRSGSERAGSGPSKDRVESKSGISGKNRKNELQGTSQSSGKRTPSTRKGFQKLTSFFRRRTSKSQDSGSSFSSHTETPRQEEQPPPALNTVEEAPSDASFQIALPPLLEPHGSGSAIQTPHPLEDVMSTRNEGQGGSAKSLGGFAAGRSGEASAERSVGLLPSAYASSKSIDSGKSESSLEERFYMLKVNFVLKKDMNSPDEHPPPRNIASACGEATGSGEVKAALVSRASSQSCPEIPDIEPTHQISLQKPQGYIPTNDINSILQESKVDAFRLRGPLTDSQLKSVLKINGKWKTDWELSDSYDSLCQVMELGWVFRKGLENSDTLIFESNAKECKSIAKVAGLVNLTEKRPWDQSVVVHRRRDLRRGPCRCWVERYDGGIILRMDWDNPVGGTCYEFIELTEDCQTMVLRQELFRKNNGPSSIVRMVLRRSE